MGTTNNETQTINLDENTTATFTKVNGKFMVPTSDIARVFGKAHKDMIKHMKAKTYLEHGKVVNIWNSIGVGEIAHSSWTNSNNKTHDDYLFSKKAFDIFVLGFTGPVANYYRVKYVEAFHKMEALVAKVARGEINLSVEASELLNSSIDSMANSEGLWPMHKLANLISDTRKGANMSNQKLYQILRDMHYVRKNENCSTVLGGTYLTDVYHPEHKTYSVKVYKSFSVPLVAKILEFLTKENHELLPCMGEPLTVDPMEIIKYDLNEEGKTYTLDNDNLERFMNSKGEKDAFEAYNKSKDELYKLETSVISSDAKERGFKEVTLKYNEKLIPKDATPTILDGECTGYTIKIPGGTITWED